MAEGACSSDSKGDVTENLASVLIVGEDSIFRRIHKAILASIFKMKETTVSNGKKAVDLYHSGKYFDIVFMDMDMPVMDGIKATKELRAMVTNFC
ncbi:hypothetical protein L6164_036963 [Bauhinia variegata]|uniref:Uncharacterized protein n=1 Tax=Bauhinia variegata TaxID=167791 RepID=A0ACB9KIH9_BAUVA|nr:hypothetical protein L6164_036963 [Bauhinia variegata]